MSSSRDEVKDKLCSIASQLLELREPESTVDVEIARWLASAINAFLDGSADTMDAALGLVKPRGREPKELRNDLIAQEIVNAPVGATAAQISESLTTKYPKEFTEPLEAKQLSRVRNNKALMAEAQAEKISSEVNKRIADGWDSGKYTRT